MLAYAFEGRRYDCGSKLGYLEATVDFGLKHPEVGAGFRTLPRRPQLPMTLNELRYIVAVAQERSFGRAATRCFVSQPALSVAIQKLEDELGAALFERGKAEVTVTPLGERIVEQAQKVLEEAATHPRNRAGGRNQLVGVLQLGVIYTVAPYLLPDLIPALHAVAPQMPLEIEENLTENLETALKTGRIDAAIIALPFASPGVVTEFLYEEPFQVVVPRGHQWAKRKSVAPDELATEHTILLNVGHCFRDQVLDACPELNRSDAHGDPHQFARDGAQHGRIGTWGVGAAARRADAALSQPAGRAGAVHAAGADEAHRARLSEELSAARGDHGDTRKRHAVSGQATGAGCAARSPVMPDRRPGARTARHARGGSAIRGSGRVDSRGYRSSAANSASEPRT